MRQGAQRTGAIGATSESRESTAEAGSLKWSYMNRFLWLTLFAPEMVQAILDGEQPAELQLNDLLEGFRLERKRAGVSGRLAAETS
jgi:hypothetical protein